MADEAPPAAVPSDFVYVDYTRGELTASGVGFAGSQTSRDEAHAACRAAELDARRRLTGFAHGVFVQGSARVEDFELTQDDIATVTRGVLAGIRVTNATLTPTASPAPAEGVTCRVIVRAPLPDTLRHLLPPSFPPQETPSRAVRLPARRDGASPHGPTP